MRPIIELIIAVLLDFLVLSYMFLMCFAAFTFALYLISFAMSLIQNAGENGGFIKGFVRRPVAAIKAAHRQTVDVRIRGLLSAI